jgi:hypothetical protein
MAIRIKSQKSYYTTEFNVELPANSGELHDLLKAMKSTGKTVVLYNQGTILGINVEQKEKVPAGEVDEKIRELLGLGTEFL